MCDNCCRDLCIFCVEFLLPKLRSRKFFDKYVWPLYLLFVQTFTFYFHLLFVQTLSACLASQREPGPPPPFCLRKDFTFFAQLKFSIFMLDHSETSAHFLLKKGSFGQISPSFILISFFGRRGGSGCVWLKIYVKFFGQMSSLPCCFFLPTGKQTGYGKPSFTKSAVFLPSCSCSNRGGGGIQPMFKNLCSKFGMFLRPFLATWNFREKLTM